MDVLAPVSYTHLNLNKNITVQIVVEKYIEDLLDVYLVLLNFEDKPSLIFQKKNYRVY